MSNYHVAEFDKAVPAEYLEDAYPIPNPIKIKIHGPENESHWLSVNPRTLNAIRAALRYLP